MIVLDTNEESKTVLQSRPGCADMGFLDSSLRCASLGMKSALMEIHCQAAEVADPVDGAQVRVVLVLGVPARSGTG